MVKDEILTMSGLNEKPERTLKNAIVRRMDDPQLSPNRISISQL
jgi:hypothetical protein